MSLETRRTLAARLQQETGVRTSECYQCGKCSAGCPAAGEMDLAPSRLLRMLQLELPQHEERVLRSRAIWMCVGCETCLTRCPNEVDVPRAMDFLRQQALAASCAHPDSAPILAFHRAFLRSIEGQGRLYEMGMILDYKLHTGRLFQDAALAPAMFGKGKIGLLPHASPGKKSVKRIFERVRAAESKAPGTPAGGEDR